LNIKDLSQYRVKLRKNTDDKGARKVLIAALNDRFSGLRQKAIGVLNMKNEDIQNMNADLRSAALPILVSLLSLTG
jgi:aminopeptidase N